MKRILFLTQGDQQTASSRHRVYQYLPFLEKAGCEAIVHPAVSGEEHHETFIVRSARGHLSRAFRTFTRRVRDLHQLGDYDYVYVQKPVLPAPLFNIELRIAREARLIFDFDDAIFLKKPGGAALTGLWPQAKRIAAICRRAHRVVVGNEYLAESVRADGVDPVVLPTAVDAEAFAADSGVSKHSQKIPVIGWVGSPSTQADLNLIIPSLIDLHSRTPFVVRIIGGIPSAMPVRFPIEWKPWNLQSEIAEIAHLDFGLAPLDFTPWNQGKCGLKVLQYWAAGIPVVASPVGVHKQMIQDGENGMLAANRNEWTGKLLALIKDTALRRRVIEKGRQTVREKYSLQALAPRFLSLFEETRDPDPSVQPSPG